MSEHDHLIAMLNRLKLTALCGQLDSLIDEAGRRELTNRESLALFCEPEIAVRDQRRIDMGFGLARFPFVRELTSFDFAAQPSCGGMGQRLRRSRRGNGDPRPAAPPQPRRHHPRRQLPIAAPQPTTA